MTLAVRRFSNIIHSLTAPSPRSIPFRNVFPSIGVEVVASWQRRWETGCHFENGRDYWHPENTLGCPWLPFSHIPSTPKYSAHPAATRPQLSHAQRPTTRMWRLLGTTNSKVFFLSAQVCWICDTLSLYQCLGRGNCLYRLSSVLCPHAWPLAMNF